MIDSFVGRTAAERRCSVARRPRRNQREPTHVGAPTGADKLGHFRLSMRCQRPSMRNLAAANRTYLLRRNSDDCRRLSGESYKFNLVSLVTRVHMHHRPDVARLQALV